MVIKKGNLYRECFFRGIFVIEASEVREYYFYSECHFYEMGKDVDGDSRLYRTCVIGYRGGGIHDAAQNRIGYGVARLT